MGAGEIVRATLDLYRAHARTFLALSLAVALPKAAVVLAEAAIPDATAARAASLVGMLGVGLCSLWAMGAIIDAAAEFHRGRVGSNDRWRSVGQAKMMPLVLTGLALIVAFLPLLAVPLVLAVFLPAMLKAAVPGAVALGLAAVIVGVAFALWYLIHVFLPSLLCYTITALEDLRGFAALRRSREMVEADHRGFWDNALVRIGGVSLFILALNLALYGIALLPMLGSVATEDAAAVPERTRFLANLIQAAVGWPLLPVSLIAYAIFYEDLQRRVTGSDRPRS